MSTDPTGTTPTEATSSSAPVEAPDGVTGTDDVLSSGHTTDSGDERESFFGRHSAVLTALMAAIIVAAVAIVGLWYYRGQADDRNAATERAFTKSVESQGATVETIECDGDTCSAVISGQAYTVLVQEDENGKQHFGVAAYAGN